MQSNIANLPKPRQSEDIAYTVNHALACTASDIASPFIGNWTQKYLSRRIDIGCGHDHSDHEHAHAGRLSHWLLGEAVGDFGAVPITVAAERFAPGIMRMLRRVMEPILGPFFKSGAKRAARSWAQNNDVALIGSPEEKSYEKKIYEYEMQHLPQAAVWTASSVALNLITQKLAGNHGSLLHLAAGKLAGSGISAAAVIAGRGAFPDAAHRWDGFAAGRIFEPASVALSGVFGVDAETVKYARQKDDKMSGEVWKQRIKSQKAVSTEEKPIPALKGV